MDRQQAAEALQLLKKVVSQARDETALENWGLVWIMGGLTNGGAFIATHFMLAAKIWSPGPYALLWLPILAVNTIAMYMKQRAGSRSFVEAQVWNIWNSFIGCMALLAFTNLIMGLDYLFMPPVAAILAAFAFSMMGSTMGRWWFVPAIVWVGMTLVLAFLPGYQFLLFGIGWAVTQCTNGTILHANRIRKLADPARARIV